jgi:CheY-like chemotaxis protein
MNRLRILLVEDDDGVSELLKDALGNLGYAVVRAKNSIGALGLIRKDSFAFDLVIADTEMPVLSGLEFAEGMTQAGIRTPVILYAAHTDRALLDKARAAGFSVVKKSSDPSSLLTCVRRRLES